ncbi:hypothetical protein ACE6H2_007711 [Prunus campanulata]
MNYPYPSLASTFLGLLQQFPCSYQPFLLASLQRFSYSLPTLKDGTLHHAHRNQESSVWILWSA